ncbi:MAG: hypothetical protein LBQ42_09790 [Synergistaceae bacterium]|jgi:hypothetical protein|nr:hypothetical protein [Synergistaceae bacterium]
MNDKRKRRYAMAVGCCFLSMSAFFAPPASAAVEDRPSAVLQITPEPEVYTVTGRLTKAERVGRFWEIELQVAGGAAHAYLAETCVFFDEKGEQISESDFLENYIDKVVTIDFLEDSEGKNAIIECRAER